MSAKDEFLKKSSENKEAQISNQERVKRDIQEFRSRVDNLATQISQWVDGTGIQVITGQKRLNDETVSFALGSGANASYEVTTIQLKNNAKSATITPEWLYGLGHKGNVDFVVTTPNSIPRQMKFSLCMGPDEGWIISGEGQRKSEGETLTEETFFQAIQKLA
ncbi:hypothetical protein [Lelliottia wanjuensis]|uniref:hypothetical protein n=1 Tax=Lelliottia wanjuensis TaxID=3050585 RepID=UPI00254E2626|nr:hypothetical protein [Lelliottia sp. V104_15]MDK9604619.1 hypothetical protein [Lelliottia sp. V104_15]